MIEAGFMSGSVKDNAGWVQFRRLFTRLSIHWNVKIPKVRSERWKYYEKVRGVLRDFIGSPSGVEHLEVDSMDSVCCCSWTVAHINTSQSSSPATPPHCHHLHRLTKYDHISVVKKRCISIEPQTEGAATCSTRLYPRRGM